MSLLRDDGVRLLLADAVADAERVAPAVDPLTRLREAQERLARRKAGAVSLAFVLFVLALQALPRPAVGATPTAPVAVAAAGAGPGASGSVD